MESRALSWTPARALEAAGTASAVVLVEGVSDRIALETAAKGRGRDLEAERVVIVPMGGAHAIRIFLVQLSPLDPRLRLAGLCDVQEEGLFRRAVTAAGVGSPGTRAEMEQLGFHVCVDDLEDELVRAVGSARVEALFEQQGDLRAFRSLQSQLVWRGREPEEQMRRFLGSGARRKLRYARFLVEAAIATGTLPRPLDAVLTALDRRDARRPGT